MVKLGIILDVVFSLFFVVYNTYVLVYVHEVSRSNPILCNLLIFLLYMGYMN